ncbi:DUF3710 domain-containing protein [Bombiscardovia coagulans]|uniref:DUF3710 domain-containing protein n=1 Tax=Bombiscardovia coagulans TaxID=686666 RepID=A0A261EPJ5_9BIFI|nr:DUF3710 domain-containing protein [Bombiscardovia coagulans]OZG48606.1 hypothetical protein BOCO_1302 [Bombiscardovia coagulans]
MGLFGFGNKRKSVDGAAEGKRDQIDDDKNDDSQEGELERGFSKGPWDVHDENVVDYDDYLDIGALYLPFKQGIELRIKVNKDSDEILGATITYGDSSLEVEAFAAPKTMGLWDMIRQDLKEANAQATEKEGVFGAELTLPVSVKDKVLKTRIVGIDGPRWMLRGIFSGPAANQGEEKTVLDEYFSDIVVDRGEEPLAPRDLIPMHTPVTPAERAAQAASENEQSTIPDEPKGPFDSDQQTEVKTTLSRGPMFSEVR